MEPHEIHLNDDERRLLLAIAHLDGLRVPELHPNAAVQRLAAGYLCAIKAPDCRLSLTPAGKNLLSRLETPTR